MTISSPQALAVLNRWIGPTVHVVNRGLLGQGKAFALIQAARSDVPGFHVQGYRTPMQLSDSLFKLLDDPPSVTVSMMRHSHSDVVHLEGAVFDRAH